MNQNPYEASTTELSILPDGDRRPRGVIPLAVIYFLCGLGVVGSRIYMLVEINSKLGHLDIFGPRMLLVLFTEVVTASTAFAAGGGLLLRLKFGWWLAAFFWFSRLIRAILLPLVASAGFTTSLGGPGYIDPRSLEQIFIPSLMMLAILAYLFRTNMLRYYALDGLNKWLAIAALFGAAFLYHVAVQLSQSTLTSG